MSCEEGRIWDDEDSTSCLCSIIFSRITPFEDFMDISGTTHPNLASDSHSFEAVSHALSSPVIDQAIFPFISYFSHDESLCFRFITHFSSDLSFDSSCTYHFCNMAVLSGMFPDSCADSLSDSCRNVALLFMFPPVYKEAVLPQRKDNLVQGFTLSSALVSKVISSTVLITASGFVINTHQGLNHFDYVIKSYFSIRSQRIRISFEKYVE